MYPERLKPAPGAPLLQRGFSIVAAIFLLVILSALGAFMLSMSTMQHTTSTQDMQGSLAYQAARAGIEWGAYQVMNPENINPTLAPFTKQYVCPGAPSTLPALGGTLSKFTVTVSCSSTSFKEGGNSVTVYQLTSSASVGTAPASNYIERSMQASINTCRTAPNGAAC
ncbi:MAG: pilus assembly PilX N-terminal domain-containing protein [Burkholderiales bacterium]|nr:pilus assembly PilX N-terminal domain-containing protein [Burkholderiales bacterium]